MKKLLSLSAAILGILAAASCTQETGSPEVLRNKTVINASLAPTKTALGEKDGTSWPNYWKAGDQISVNGEVSDALADEADGVSSASFSFSGVVATPYCAVYPAAAASDFSDAGATVTVPAVQNYVEGSYDPAAFVMTGKSEDDSKVTLSPFVSVLHLSLFGDASISSIKLTGAEGAALSGSFTTDFSASEAKTVSNVVELTAAAPVALPAEFFICVPAGVSGELKVEMFDSDGGSFSKTANLKAALEAGKVYSPAAFGYGQAGDFAITAENVTSSTAVICWASSHENAYTISVYSDSACSTLVSSYVVDAANACWGAKAPRFCISGLEPGTTYFVTVKDETNNLTSNALPVTAREFEIVQVPETEVSEGAVILAEDFGELCWDCDLIGQGAGWFPTEAAQGTSFTTVEVASYQAAETSGEKQLSAQAKPVAASRLANWAQGANKNIYIHPGYLKLVGSGKVTHIVTPAFNCIPEGKAATVEVEITASAYYSESSGSFATTNAIVAVQPAGDYKELKDNDVNNLDLTGNVQEFTLAEKSEWNTYKVTISGVGRGARLAFGARADVTGNSARMNISDIKVTVKSIQNDGTFMLITSVSDLLEFSNVVAAGNKTIDARVEISGAKLSLSQTARKSFNTLEGYRGTFDGNGKTIAGLDKPMFGTLYGTVKNLTLESGISVTDAESVNWGIFAKVLESASKSAPASLERCNARGSINYTPAAALSSDCQIGGLVGNNRGGSLTRCTNSATVVLGDNGVKNSSQVSIGGVLGRTQKGGEPSVQGKITGCSNYGSVTCNAALGENIYIGGVLGYQVEKAESISECSNSGAVTVGATFSTAKALHIGGVIGMGKGSIEACSNESAATVTTEAGSSAGTYLCQGGVVGRLNREKDSYSGLSNAGTLNVAAVGGSTARLIGGVIGRCDEGAAVTELTNSGTINYSAEVTYKTYIGGVVASNEVADNALDACKSTGGAINFTGATTEGNLYIGGVVGYSTRPVFNCTNAMDLNIGGEFERTSNNYNGVGGVVGSMSADVPLADCLNTGKVTYSQQISGAGYTFVGGVAGRTAGSIENCSNGGTVTITGKNGAQNPFYGGVVGSTDSKNEHSITGKYSGAPATNYGAVVVNTETQSNKYIYVGGVAGRLHTNGSMKVTNSGPVTVTRLKCTTLFLGGLTGLANGPIESGSKNMASGDITVDALTSSYESYIGGAVGKAVFAVTADNDGDITVTGNAKASRHYLVAGIVGRAEAPIASSTNKGKISSAAQMAGGKDYYLQVGGIVGYNNGSAPLSNCHNKASVVNTGDSGGYLCVGGITSESDADITNCDNTGDVSNSGSSANSRPVCVGGVAGIIYGITVSNAFNTGAVSNSGTGSGSIPNGVNIGGVVGRIAGVAKLTGTASKYNYNSGTVSDTSASDRVAMGGVVGLCAGEGTDMAYVKNLDSADITYQGNERYDSHIGGVLGCATEACSMDYASNAGDLTIKSITVSHQVFFGGVIGGIPIDDECTFSNLTNSGKISCPYVANGENMAAKDNSVIAMTYIGGIAGIGAYGSKKFYNCSNSGAIAVYNQVPVRMGGIIGYATTNPTGCVNTGPINYCRYNTKSNGTTGVVGGIVGYMGIANPHDLTNDATVRTTGSSPNCFVGGIVGQGNSSTVAFTNCNVGTTNGDSQGRHTISGSGEGSFTGSGAAGLFISVSSKRDWDFKGCKIKKGTICQNKEIDESNVNSALVGRNNHPNNITNPPTFVDSF